MRRSCACHLGGPAAQGRAPPGLARRQHPAARRRLRARRGHRRPRPRCGAGARHPRRLARPARPGGRRAPGSASTPTGSTSCSAVLSRAGVLEDAAADRRSLAALSPAERDRLGPDLAAASLRGRQRGRRRGPRPARGARWCRSPAPAGSAPRSRRCSPSAGVGAVVRRGRRHHPGTPTSRRPPPRRRTSAPAARTPPCAPPAGSPRRSRTMLPRGRQHPDLAVLAAGRRHRPGAGRPAAARRRAAPGRPGAGDTGVVGPLVLPGPVVLPALPRPAPQRPRPGLAEHRRPADRRARGSAPPPATPCSPPRSPPTPRCRCSPSSTATRHRRRSTARSRSPRPTAGYADAAGRCTRRAAAPWGSRLDAEPA